MGYYQQSSNNGNSNPNPKNCRFHISFGNFRDVFCHQVVPVSPCNPQSVTLVETKLKGLIIQFDDDAQIALEYINRNHSPLYKKLDPVSHGGETLGLDLSRF